MNDYLIGYILFIDKLRLNVKEMVMKFKKENIIFIFFIGDNNVIVYVIV